VFALRALTPEGLVVCVQQDGRRALELAVNGRCLAICPHCSIAGTCQPDSSATPELESDSRACEDLSFSLSTARSEESLQLIGAQVELPALNEGTPVAAPALRHYCNQRTALTPDPPDCGPPLQFAGLILLRI
jgi:hypothetical protein